MGDVVCFSKVYAVERNRRIFKTLFKPELMELFLRVAHYSWKVDHYTPLAVFVNGLDPMVMSIFHKRIRETNIERAPTTEIIDDVNKDTYLVWEKIGEGML